MRLSQTLHNILFMQCIILSADWYSYCCLRFTDCSLCSWVKLIVDLKFLLIKKKDISVAAEFILLYVNSVSDSNSFQFNCSWLMKVCRYCLSYWLLFLLCSFISEWNTVNSFCCTSIILQRQIQIFNINCVFLSETINFRNLCSQ